MGRKPRQSSLTASFEGEAGRPYATAALEIYRGSHIAIIAGENGKNFKAIKASLDKDIVILPRKTKIDVHAPDQKTADVVVAILRDLKQIVGQRVKGAPLNDSDIQAAIRKSIPAAAEAIPVEQSYPVKPRNDKQREYLETIANNRITVGVGPAGTGKTFLAAAMAHRALQNGKVQKIILTRPIVEAGEKMGFLPGDLKAKADPYMRPLYDALTDFMSPERLQKELETGRIEIAPLAFMRGRTLKNAFIILDEAQNTTPEQMKMFLTRKGEGSIMVVNGDLTQCDLPVDRLTGRAKSGLSDALEILAGKFPVVAFETVDIVRDPDVAIIAAAYEERTRKTGGPAPFVPH